MISYYVIDCMHYKLEVINCYTLGQKTMPPYQDDPFAWDLDKTLRWNKTNAICNA